MLFVIVCCVKQGLISSEEKKATFFGTIDVKNYVEKTLLITCLYLSYFLFTIIQFFYIRNKVQFGRFRFSS